jgi:hypothetical protein
VTWLSIVETSLACFHRRCTLTSWGPSHILILRVWGLKEIRVRNHLSWWGDKSLSSWLRNPLNTLLHKAEGRSSRQRSHTNPRVATLLTLAFLLSLAHQYSSSILEHKGLVYHGLEIVEVTCFQSIGKFIIQFVEETLLFLFVGIHVVGSVAGKLHEMSDILAHRHVSLLQILEFLLLELDYTLRHMMRSKNHLKLISVDAFRFLMSCYICIPPIRCRAYQLV